MKLLLCHLMLLPLISLKAQVTPDKLAYDRGYEAVLAANKITHAIWIVEESEDNWYAGDTVAIFEYDNEGRLIRDIFISGWEEEPNIITTYNYDSKGLLQSTSISGLDLYPIESTFKYKKNILESSFSGGADARKYSYQSAGGKVTERIGQSAYFEVDEDGNDTGNMVWQETERTTYSYNSNGQVEMETFYNRGELAFSIRYLYNAKGRIIKMERYYADATEPEAFDMYDYNDAGLMIGTTTITYDGIKTVLKIDNKQ